VAAHGPRKKQRDLGSSWGSRYVRVTVLVEIRVGLGLGLSFEVTHTVLRLDCGRQGIICTPTGGGTPPIDINTHTQTVLPHWGVYTVL